MPYDIASLSIMHLGIDSDHLFRSGVCIDNTERQTVSQILRSILCVKFFWKHMMQRMLQG